MAECWSCGAERRDAVFCPTCGKVQPVSKSADHFMLLEIPRAMRLDASELERRYREVSRKVHPDRFGMATPVERKLALEQTTKLNDAYRTLKDPQKRGEYLLELEGIKIGHEEARTKNPELLMEMMERQERVDTEASHDALERIQDETRSEERSLYDALARYFDDHADTKDRAIDALERLRYLKRLDERIDAKLEEI
jgi:molecular chaperone HscB